MISIVIIGILPAVESFRGRNSRIEEANFLLKKACSMHGFLFVDQASCWRDPEDFNEINQKFHWRDGLHLNKRGCDMLASIYCKTIKTAIAHQTPTTTTTPTQTSFILKKEDSDSWYKHVIPAVDSSVPLCTHQIHNRKKK